MSKISFKITINEVELMLMLADGESFEHNSGGPHDEGFSYTHEKWVREGDEIHHEHNTNSRDCDGPFETFGEYVWTEADGVNENGFPKYRQVSRSQRDHYAEMMGY